MNLFNIFSSKNKNNSIEFFYEKILKLEKELRNGKKDEDVVIDERKTLFKELSKILFISVKNNDLNTITSILLNPKFTKSELLDEKGRNIIEHLLLNGNNDLFEILYIKYYKDVKVYIGYKIPLLFTIILNTKNFEMIKFFLTDEELSNNLKKENIVNCLFTTLQGNRKDLTDLIINNYSNFLDSRNIEASMIYSISYNQENELKTLFSYPKLIEKFSDNDIGKMLAFSVLNKNVDAIEIMIENKHFMQSIENSDINMTKSILQLAYNKGNTNIITSFMDNPVLKNNLTDILRIENK